MAGSLLGQPQNQCSFSLVRNPEKAFLPRQDSEYLVDF